MSCAVQPDVCDESGWPLVAVAQAKTFASCAVVALVLIVPGALHAIDPRTALDALGFPGDTQRQVEAGRFVQVALPTRSDRDLNVGIAFLVAKHAPAALARTVREGKRVLNADSNVIAYGDFVGDGSVSDLAGLRLTARQLTAFGSAAPGDAINLSLDEIAALHAAGDHVDGIEHAVHALLLARYRAYRSKGLAGIAPYGRRGSAINARDDLAAVDRGARATGVLSTKLYDLLDHYPDDQPPDFAENHYWVQLRAHGADTIALEHVLQATFDDMAVLVQRQYYVSTGYNAEQAIVTFLPIGDGALVIYTNHTSTGPSRGARRRGQTDDRPYGHGRPAGETVRGDSCRARSVTWDRCVAARPMTGQLRDGVKGQDP